MDKNTIKEKRKQLLLLSTSTKDVKKGNVKYTGQKVCSICGRTLSMYDSAKDRYETIFNYKLLDCEVFKFSICSTLGSCVSFSNRKKVK